MSVQTKINKLIGTANKVIASCCGKNFMIHQLITDIPDDDDEFNRELREDGGFELREDNGLELRQ